ncbi:ATP-binding cassette domain-containing protein [Paenibacillus ginsengarvi]|uniref:ATP-binding cassette domain-containing protein n=2 Tax=Paenibacillus ginsengarvi TaxID=400777 RepID=A0A3B0C9V5_9BACL|nr:ATP-binding cassette domain-containing protein [Paenibacillus ginsengarvi]
MLIEVNRLSKSYTTFQRGHTFKETLKSLFHRKTIEVPAVKGISFQVAPGEIVGFLGPNGAGKSTTLKILTGVLHPTSGDVRIMGYVPWKQRKSYVGRIGAVFGQKSQLLWDIPPLDAFYMNKAIYSIPQDEFEETLDELTSLLDVHEVIRKPTRQLSLGERMKCEFMMAMLHRPQIVFLDEPTIGLDVIAKENIREFIGKMNRRGVTFILTTHDLDDVEQLAGRVIVINHGEIVFDDSIVAMRSFVGGGKMVRMLTEERFPDLNMPGATVVRMISPHEAEIELDTGVIKINDFFARMNGMCTLLDMSVQELPIDRVIKQLYLTKSP